MFGDKDTVLNLLNLPVVKNVKPEAIELKTKKIGDDSQLGAYLSIRYFQTCSGALLKDGKVFTAAHCYYDWNDGSSSTPGSFQWRSANVHKQYVIGNNWQNSTNINISMADNLTPSIDNISPGFLKITNGKAIDINTSDDYAIINLNNKFEGIIPFEIGSFVITQAGQYKLYAAGFGQTEPFQSEIPPVNAKLAAQYFASLSSPFANVTPMTFVSNAKCVGYYQQAGISTNEISNLMCAGTPSEASLCAGDSGAPIYSLNVEGVMILHGHFEGSPVQCTNSAPIKSEPTEWVSLPGGFSTTYKLCSNSVLKSWAEGLGVNCVSD
jgi:hypothetical protein